MVNFFTIEEIQLHEILTSILKSSTGLFCNYLKRIIASTEKQKPSLLENHNKVKS